MKLKTSGSDLYGVSLTNNFQLLLMSWSVSVSVTTNDINKDEAHAMINFTYETESPFIIRVN